jgi:hypothetical protein
MNELTYLLAVLINKDILSVDEAKKLQNECRKGIVNSNIGEMVSKVERALKDKSEGLKKVSATDFFKSKK